MPYTGETPQSIKPPKTRKKGAHILISEIEHSVFFLCNILLVSCNTIDKYDKPIILTKFYVCICSSIIEQFASTVSNLAQILANILAEKLGHQSSFFKENCLPNTCYLRLNRYPPCPIDFRIHGLMPHTDSDFLTILYQDQVGGLQLVKDGKWVAVKPNPDALIINIGDLFQVLKYIYKLFDFSFLGNKLFDFNSDLNLDSSILLHLIHLLF